jgi:hypothetical protein
MKWRFDFVPVDKNATIKSLVDLSAGAARAAEQAIPNKIKP